MVAALSSDRRRLYGQRQRTQLRLREPVGKAALRFKQPRRMPFTMRNIEALPDGRPGIYSFYDKNGKLLYVGSAAERGVKARLDDTYRRRGDYHTIPSKRKLREKIAKVDIQWGKNVYDNREIELKKKQGLPFNTR